jgi:hypothetical protein
MSSASDKPPHPACLPVEELLSECEAKRQRRSGPGGQHRNKVETAVILTHLPTGISAEANERRSQSENHDQAVFRLRLRLALQVRPRGTPANPSALPEPSNLWRSRCGNGRIKVAADHPDFPALLAEVLDLLSLCDYDHKPVAEHLGCTVSQLIKFLKTEPKAFVLMNANRQSQGLFPLK